MDNTKSIAERTDVPPDVASTSNEYAHRFAGEVGDYFLEVQAESVRKFLNRDFLTGTSDKPTALELGGGHCQLLDTYISQGFQVTVQGSDKRSFIRPTELGYKMHPNVQFLEHSIYELSEIPENSYDIVSGIRLMAHLKNWEDFLAQCFRISRRGIIFDYANLYSINIISPILFHVKKRVEKNTRPFFCQRSTEVRRKLKQLGASEILEQPQFILPMGLHRAMKSKGKSIKLEAIAKSLGLTMFGSPVMMLARKEFYHREV